MEREFWILMLRWAKAIAAMLVAGKRHSEDYILLKEKTEIFIKRCEEGK